MSQITTHEFITQARQAEITATKLNSTTVRLQWTLPNPSTLIGGGVVLLSETTTSSDQFPEDGKRYIPSTDWQAPNDKIGSSVVVAFWSEYFGDTVINQVDVTNVDPNKIYYASFHPATSVLQYYPVGVQSYPLETSRFEKQSDAYAGSIPVSSNAPENPESGQVYYDPVDGKIYMWSSDIQIWLEVSEAPIIPRKRAPFIEKGIFLNSTDVKLKIWLNDQWNELNSTNARIKFGATTIPLGSVTAEPTVPPSAVTGDVIYITLPPTYAAPTTREVQVKLGANWINLVSNLIQYYDGTDWVDTVVLDNPASPSDPQKPPQGEFYYNSTTKQLNVWNGNEWVRADTDQIGVPTTDKIGIGTDGSYDERLRLMKILRTQLGSPKICVEITDEGLNIAIDNALDEYRRRSDTAYDHKYILMTLKQGQQLYHLNDPRDGTNKIVDVLAIHRINLLGVTALSSDSNIYAQMFYNQYFQGAMVDILSMHLVNQMSEVFEKIFAGNLTYSWDESSRQLFINRRVMHGQERVILEVACERTEQELLTDRWAKQWLQSWAMGEALEQIGLIRSKFGTVPGPNGGITLNGAELLQMAQEHFTECLRQINDFEVGNSGVNWGNAAFLIG